MAKKKTLSGSVMSVGSYVIAALLMSIPLIGLVICIVWAFFSCNNQNKRNFARACLIFVIIGIVLSLVFYSSTNSLMASLGTLGGFRGVFDFLKGD
ncbi:MAG: hypothetical protein LBH07_04175 [Treponema sp.]|nr:hypothetical protein [Treponema sp.]